MSNNKIYYDVMSLSNELETAKPHSKIFLNTINDLETIPKNSIHFGDNPVADILGATNIGMDAVFNFQKIIKKLLLILIIYSNR